MRHAMQSAGLFDDLRAYPNIMESLQNWIKIGAMYDSTGALTHIPVEIYSLSLYTPLSEDKLAQYSVDLPGTVLTRAQFRAISKQVRSQSTDLQPIYFSGMNPYLAEPFELYCVRENDIAQGVLDFDTPEFRALLDEWKALFADDLVLKGFFGIPDESTYVLYACLPFINNANFSQILRGQFFYPPTDDGEKLCLVQTSGLYLNRYSDQKDSAADFLATLASMDVRGRDDYWTRLFLKDTTLYPNHAKWFSGEDRFYSIQPSAPVEGYANWVDVLEHSAPSANTDIVYNVIA